MDVPAFMTNDDITPYALPAPNIIPSFGSKQSSCHSYAFGSTRDKRDVVCAQGRWALCEHLPLIFQIDFPLISPTSYSITNGDDARLLYFRPPSTHALLLAEYISPARCINSPAHRYNPLSKPVTNRVDFVSIACGHEHSIALSADGKLWGWGSNEFEQLGVRSTASATVFPSYISTRCPTPKPPATFESNPS
jgi:hypothetical protein